MEIGRQLHELEETMRYGEIQLAIFLAPVDEEVDGEDGFAVCEEAWGPEGGLGVMHRGVLVEEAPEFGCDGQVVFSSSKLVAEIDELLRKETQFKYRGTTNSGYIHLEAGLVEVAVGSEKEIGWVMCFSRGDYHLTAKYIPRLILVSPMRKLYL